MSVTTKLATAAVLAATALTAVSAAQAQTYGGGYPVCLQSYAPVQYIDCRYDSIPQCQASASGRSATCLVNPFFNPAEQPRRRRR